MKAIGAIGKVVSGAAALEAGKFTRRVMRTNKANALRDGVAESSRLRDAARLAIGRQVAGLAGSGALPDTGSALDALTETAIESEIEIMTAERRAMARAQGFEVQGNVAYAQGYNQFVGGIFNGAASLIDKKTRSYAG